MALSEIKQHLLHNEKASVKELSDLLSIERGTLEAMLKHMETKGLISIVTETEFNKNHKTACLETFCSSKVGCLCCPFSNNITSMHTLKNTYVIWKN